MDLIVKDSTEMVLGSENLFVATEGKVLAWDTQVFGCLATKF
jgi:hypothetical protein